MILLAKLDSEQASYHPKQINVAALVEHVADRVLPLAAEDHVTLKKEVAEGMYIYADEEKMLRALLNLVVNGVRHAHSVVKITAAMNGKQKMLVVEDDGEGISEELLPHIFHRFVKGKQGETGLGLAITRAIIEQSGGKITVENKSDEGARFVILFPGNA
ncbi:HAMP domain-containing sensor histidine kinase [Virgibacillus sp. 179-BFC.A HS]|uniref:histidine kinase n=1 Tax=Tigheibacillus jepli TaxID=3035914 RepID=A0ABU5CL26_9BACI|nr:HAMP domain-containing sensor histidine kinase [Virgibacillus sp. 179-BFC.A HS]MDY0406925.1 HAMP domain-containing sensor histidine kinase [Virgibacillus sp. 179-BFC.A HS]